MPILTDDMESRKIGGTAYTFSAAKIETLGAPEYTLVDIEIDVSSSTLGFRPQMTACLKEIIKACRRSPRADNLMLRLVLFADKVTEVHGFKLLTQCNPDDYDNVIQGGGMTALYDASYTGVQAMNQYGKDLADQDFFANGIAFTLTDGMDNRSKMTPSEVGKALSEGPRNEWLESTVSVLIGLNTDPQISGYLQRFKDEAGLSQYVDVGNADERSLAKVASFVSRSISSQSQSLGSGGPSQSLAI